MQYIWAWQFIWRNPMVHVLNDRVWWLCSGADLYLWISSCSILQSNRKAEHSRTICWWCFPRPTHTRKYYRWTLIHLFICVRAMRTGSSVLYCKTVHLSLIRSKTNWSHILYNVPTHKGEIKNIHLCVGHQSITDVLFSRNLITKRWWRLKCVHEHENSLHSPILSSTVQSFPDLRE